MFNKLMIITLALLLSISPLFPVVTYAAPEDYAYIPDPRLKEQLNNWLGRGLVQDDILITDLAARTTAINANGKSIIDLTGIQHVGATALYLNNNQITDASILYGMSNLVSVRLHYNLLTNVDGFSGMPNLVNLSVANNQITHLTLENLPMISNSVTPSNLASLFFSGNPLSELSLTNIPKYTTLDYQNMGLQKITLNNLPKLTTVNVSNNDFSLPNSLNFSVLPVLNSFIVTNSKISSLNGFAQANGFSSSANLTLNVSNNNISNLTPLAGNLNIKTLNISTNQVFDLSPISSLTNLTAFYFAFNRVHNVTPIMGFANYATWKASGYSQQNFIEETGFVNQHTFKTPVTTIAVDPGQSATISIPWLYGASNANFSTFRTKLAPKATSQKGNLLSPITENGNYTHQFSVTGLKVGVDTITFEATPGYVKTFQITVNDGPVSFADADLQACINDKLGQPQNAVITITQMEALSGTLDCSNRTISNLGGLEYADQLTDLNFSFNTISSISPLQSLVNLINVDLSNNPISSLTPLVGKNTIRTLNVSNNALTSVSDVGGITGLTSLNVDNNTINTVGPLNTLTNLQILSLNNTNIINVDSLSTLVNLTTVSLNNNRLGIVNGLNNATSLTYLDVSNNNLTDTSSLSSLTNLETLNVNNNNIKSLNGLSGMTNLTSLTYAFNLVHDVSPIKGLAVYESTKDVSRSGDNFIEEIGFSNQYNFSVPSDQTILEGNMVNVYFPWTYNNVLMTTEPTRLTKTVNVSNAHTTVQSFSYNTIQQAHQLRVNGITEGTSTITVQMVEGYSKSFNSVIIPAPVNIPDVNLKMILNEKLGKGLVTTDIYRTELESLTGTLVGNNKNISDLTGLEKAINLTNINVYGNFISDVSMLTPLASLTTLNIGNNKIVSLPNNLPSNITTLSAVNQKTGYSLKNINGLSNLINLKLLNLNFNELTDISGLSGITTLENVNLSYQSGTEITDISALANKPMLHTLDLTNNNISSLSALNNNNALKTLHINGNLITDLTPLSGLSLLERITASQNKLPSLNGLESLNNLNYLDFSDQIGVKITNIIPLGNKNKLTYLKLNGNQIADLTPLNTMTTINQLELSSNNITNLTGFAPSNTLRTLNLYGNGITSIVPLVGMTNITNLTLSYNKISDASPLASLTGLTTLQLQSNRLSTINSLATHPRIATFKSGSTFNGNFVEELSNQYTFTVPMTALEIEKGNTQIIDISWLYNNVAYTAVSEPVSSQLNKQVSSSNGNTVLAPVWNSANKVHKLSFTGNTVGMDTITVQMTDGYTKTFQVNVIEPGLNEIRNLQETIDLGNVSLDLKNSTSVALPSFELEKTLNDSNWQLIMSMDEIRDQNGDIVEGLSFEYDNLLTVTTLEGQSLTPNANGFQKLNGSSITLLSGNETDQGIWTIATNPNALKLKMGPKTDLSNGSKTFSSVITYTIVELP